jgi:TnpA family transposase
MNNLHFSQEQLVQVAKLSDADMALIDECRGEQNKLGLGYQLGFVRLFNQFPAQVPFEPMEDLVTYMSFQLDISPGLIEQYKNRRQTIAEHRKRLQVYLNLKSFHPDGIKLLDDFLYKEALQIEPTDSLLVKATHFLRDNHILNPAEDTLRRTIYEQRKKARSYIFETINAQLSPALKERLDSLLQTDEQAISQFHKIKDAPQKPSEAGMRLLSEKLSMIEQTGALTLNLDWMNNNYKRYLSSYAINSNANKLRELTPMHRYASLICFLQDAYQDVIDYIFDMYAKALTNVHSRAETHVNNYNKAKRNVIRSCLTHHKKLCHELLAVADGSSDLTTVLTKFPSSNLQEQIEEVEILLNSKYSNSLNIVADRFSYLRKLTKPLLEKLKFDVADTGNESLVTAMQLVLELINGTIRSIPDDTKLDYLPKNIQTLVVENGKINRRKYEAATFTAIRDHIKCGNLAILGSKRFGKLDNFFIGHEQWELIKETFYQKSKLPRNSSDVAVYLTNRLQKAFDYFFEHEKNNPFAKVGKEGWILSTDAAETMSSEQKQGLEALKQWLSSHMRTIKLPDLLIEVDNDLYFTDQFLPATKRQGRTAEDICTILTAIMAYGCNIGPHTMAQMIEGVSYRQIRRIFDWQITDEAQRHALADVVNGISGIEVTKVWGEGKTSGSDAQRFGYHKKTLHRTFSHKLRDFAIEFYTFVADNFAPFYNLAKESIDRDSSKVLDGHLYNVSDLEIEEHYTDTHGYTEINFAAFAWLGISFSPRIKNIKTQWLYKIDEGRDYGSLNSLVAGNNHTIKMNYIVDNWDRMAQFYASLEAGHVTASTALKRIVGFTSKNHFYQANLQMGRILKTEHILYWMADPHKRRRTRKGLLKVDQIHQLARDITYGNRGRLKGKTLEEITSSGNCTTLIIAAIIYWQAREISRIVKEYNPEEAGIDVSLLEHISPIEWSNVVLYGEYKLNKDLVRR